MLAGLCSVPRVRGHDLPRPLSAIFHPSDPGLITVFSSAGLLLSTDGGERFELLCGTPLQLFAFEVPALRYTTDGGLLLAGRAGLQRGGGDGCGFRHPAPELAAIHVPDLIADPRDFGSSFAVTAAVSTGDAHQASRLVHSDDDGRTWQVLYAFGREDDLQQVRVWPGDPRQIYVTSARRAADGQTAEYALARSSDGGATWTEQLIPLGDGDRSFRLLYLSPRDPDRLLVMTESYAQSASLPYRILRSEDGGASFHEVLRLGALGGMASDARTDRLWLADFYGELHRSDDDGATFETVATSYHFGCLAHAHDRLWACTDDWLDGFALGYSEDGGGHFTGLLRWQDVQGLVRCPAQPDVELLCEPDWQHVQQDLQDARRAIDGVPSDDAGTDAGIDGAADAGGGVPESSPVARGGCGCRVVHERAPSRVLIMAWLAAFAIRLGRSRSSARAGTG
jgi:hypothetical protein